MAGYQFDVTPFKAAGIPPGIAAKLFQVSRVTASQWFNGHVQPHTLLAERVRTMTTLVQSAVDQKLLPLDQFPGRKNLLSSITAALQAAQAPQAN